MATKYKVGDVVGVCSDAMYEFEITQVQPKPLMYGGRCIRANRERCGGGEGLIKIGDEYAISPKQIVLKLNASGETAEEYLESRKKIEKIIKADRKRREKAKNKRRE
jgi:hypothetical protein